MYDGSIVDLVLGENIKLITGDGRQGYPQHAKYDVIHVGAAAPTIPQAVSSNFSSSYYDLCSLYQTQLAFLQTFVPDLSKRRFLLLNYFVQAR